MTLVDFAMSSRRVDSADSANGGVGGPRAGASLGVPEICYKYATIRVRGRGMGGSTGGRWRRWEVGGKLGGRWSSISVTVMGYSLRMQNWILSV